MFWRSGITPTWYYMVCHFNGKKKIHVDEIKDHISYLASYSSVGWLAKFFTFLYGLMNHPIDERHILFQ